MLNPPLPCAPIGVYDSGVGGLSVLRALKARLPTECFAYVADSANAPYGDRTPRFIESRAREIAGFLIERRAKALVIACNTASVIAARDLRAAITLPIIAMEPAIKPAARLTKTRVVLVLGTSNTMRSASVERLCRVYGADARIILQACPGLVERVERGRLQHESTLRLLEKYMRPGLDAGADVVVLGCTHYAFLAAEIARIAGPSVAVVEPSDAIARQLARVLAASAPAPRGHAATTTFYTSGSPLEMSSFLGAIGEPAARVHVLPARAGLG